MESAAIEKHKGYYGCGSAGGCGSDNGTGEGSGDSDGHGINYSRDLNECEILGTGYGRGNGHGGGGGGDSHGIPFNADLESDRLATSADLYKGDGYGFGYGNDERSCGSLNASGGAVFSKWSRENRYDVGNNNGSGGVDGRGAGYSNSSNDFNDFYSTVFKKDSFLGWLKRILGL
jgi:hypothetical protein